MVKIACAADFSARGDGITDGDTLVVLDGQSRRHKIRLSGIDAPEKAQPFGERSRQTLAKLVYDRNVRIEARMTDRYGDTVAVV